MTVNDDNIPVSVQYLDRDFDQTRAALIEYIRQNYPDGS